MDVYTISDAGLERHSAADLSQLLAKNDLLTWVDMAPCVPQDAVALAAVFGF